MAVGSGPQCDVMTCAELKRLLPILDEDLRTILASSLHVPCCAPLSKQTSGQASLSASSASGAERSFARFLSMCCYVPPEAAPPDAAAGVSSSRALSGYESISDLPLLCSAAEGKVLEPVCSELCGAILRCVLANLRWLPDWPCAADMQPCTVDECTCVGRARRRTILSKSFLLAGCVVQATSRWLQTCVVQSSAPLPQ